MVVKQNLSKLNEVLEVVVSKIPKILNFETKKLYFQSEIQKLKSSEHSPKISLES